MGGELTRGVIVQRATKGSWLLKVVVVAANEVHGIVVQVTTVLVHQVQVKVQRIVWLHSAFGRVFSQNGLDELDGADYHRWFGFDGADSLV